jgi:hypothetical protein
VVRRRREHERQAVVFGLIIVLLLVAAVGALAAYSGAFHTPFSRPIHTPEASSPQPEPCLPPVDGQPDGALPISYGDIRVRVFNASGTTGIAHANAEVLADRGFDVIATGNMGGTVEISELRFGVKGITRAYTLAAQYPGMRLVLDDRTGRAVDLLAGDRFNSPLQEDKVLLSADTPMQDVQGCLPADEITPIPREQAATSQKIS